MESLPEPAPAPAPPATSSTTPPSPVPRPYSMREVERVAGTAITLAAAAGSVPATSWVGVPSSPFAFMLATAFTAALYAKVAFRRQRKERNIGAGVFLAAPFGALNLVLCLALAVGPELFDKGLLAFVGGGGILGLLFGAPIGLVFGLAFAFPLAMVERLRERPSHDALERMCVRAGIWLGAVALGLATLGSYVVLPAARTAFLVGIGACVMGGLALIVAGAIVSARRARWVRELLCDTDVQVREVTGHDDLAGLLPVFDESSSVDPLGVIERVEQCETYRQGRRATLIARMRLRASPSARSRARAPETTASSSG